VLHYVPVPKGIPLEDVNAVPGDEERKGIVNGNPLPSEGGRGEGAI